MLARNVPETEQGAMDSLESYQQTRRVVEDFTARTLAAITSEFGKLLYVTSLCDLSSGRYHHEGLTARFPAEAVQQALGFCHHELFLRFLEMPLERQEWDLRSCLASMEGDYGTKVRRWKETEFYRSLIPTESPAYLREMFLANVRVLLDLLLEEGAKPAPGASPGPPPAR
jgi:hypothetical protein